MTRRRTDILKHDNLDDRRELYRLLGFPGMTDRRRLSFLTWCLQRCGSTLNLRVGPTHSKAGYGVHEAVLDFSMLTMQFRLDVDIALAELTRRVRKI